MWLFASLQSMVKIKPETISWGKTFKALWTLKKYTVVLTAFTYV